MKLYELVVVMNASLQSDEKLELLTSIENLIGKDAIKEKDDVWVLKAAYPLQWKKENHSIHIVSYYLDLSNGDISSLSKDLSFIKWLLRHFFYRMDRDQEFISYAETQEKLKALIGEEEKLVVSH